MGNFFFRKVRLEHILVRAKIRYYTRFIFRISGRAEYKLNWHLGNANLA